MDNILNLCKYKVSFNRVDGINVRINFECIIEDFPTYGKDMDAMNPYSALNKEFGISKIDMYTDDFNGKVGFYIIVDKDLGYKILKTFLVNTLNLEDVKRIDDADLAIYKACYGDTLFNDYIKEYEKKLSDYENLVSKQVTLDVFNLYTKKVDWYLDEKERICITIAENKCKAIHVANDTFNVLDICKALEFRFGVYMVGLIYDSCAKLAFTVENANVGYRVLKAFLKNTDESLLDDKLLITNKADALRMHESIARYKLMLDLYKSKFCKDTVMDL